jgi:hypothetical protein
MQNRLPFIDLITVNASHWKELLFAWRWVSPLRLIPVEPGRPAEKKTLSWIAAEAIPRRVCFWLERIEVF